MNQELSGHSEQLVLAIRYTRRREANGYCQLARCLAVRKLRLSSHAIGIPIVGSEPSRREIDLPLVNLALEVF